MRTALSILTVASVVWGCAPGSSSARTPVIGGKPAAPVEITAVLHADRAEVAVEFRAVATSVEVRVNGTSGLALTSPATVVSGGSFAKGGSTKAVVTFIPPAGQADLVVTVIGLFNGSRGAKAASFTIGQPTPAQLQKAGEGVTVEASGEKVKELPAERR